MQLQTKIFSWPEKGNHVIIIARGVIQTAGLERILHETASATKLLPYSPVLIDPVDAMHSFTAADIKDFVDGFEPPPWLYSNSIALVSAPEVRQLNKLSTLSFCLSNRGLKIATFADCKAAIRWLAVRT
jgi:hypothetical protein